MFSVEGYDESMEFRLFNEDFLKFRHFLLNNTFVYFKVMAKEGWVKKDTNERSEPRLQFMEMKLLNEVIPTYAKKLIINIDVNELKANQIEKIRMVLDEHQGNKPVTFEIYELEKIQKRIETEVVNKMLTDIDIDNIDSMESLEQMDIEPVLPEVEYKVINVLEMPSRNTRIEISSDLLEALEGTRLFFW